MTLKSQGVQSIIDQKSFICPNILLIYYYIYIIDTGFPGGSDDEESACNVGDLGSIPGLGRYPEEENGNPLQ